MVLALRRLSLHEVDWPRLDALPDRVVFQSREWLEFLSRSQAGAPVVAELHRDGACCGWFTGMVSRRFGIPVLGAPMPGWSTPYMGWNLLPGTSRAEALGALLPFAFAELKVAHVEVCDRWTVPEDVGGTSFAREDVGTFVVRLEPDEDAVRARMTPGTRQNLRKAERVGVTVEDAEPEGFAADYYAQLQDVFAKQGLAPTYPVRRVEQLVESLHPTGQLQLIRARDADGTSIATAVVLGSGPTAHFWGGASLRAHQRLRPNEAVFWHAFSTWARRGAVEFDFGGRGEYKRKYGAQELWVPSVRASSSPLLGPLREAARRLVALRQRASYALRRDARV